MIRGANLTSPYTQLDILSLPSVAPIFSIYSWSNHGKPPFYRWSHFTGILLAYWCYTAEVTNHTKINNFNSISLKLHYWVHDCFTFIYIYIYITLFQSILQLLIKAIISNAYYIFIQPLLLCLHQHYPYILQILHPTKHLYLLPFLYFSRDIKHSY